MLLVIFNHLKQVLRRLIKIFCFVFFFPLFQPKSDLAALLQLLCCAFAEAPPVYSKSTPPQPPPTASYRPPQGPYQSQYGGYPPNPIGSTPYPAGGPARMPMPMPMPGLCLNFKALINLTHSSLKQPQLRKKLSGIWSRSPEGLEGFIKEPG